MIHPNLEGLRANPAPIMDVFFTAMLAGYAKDNASNKPFSIPVETIVKATGETEYGCKIGQFEVIDRYHVTDASDHSGGTTFIFYRGTLVWMMQYFGCYETDAVSVLKAALRSSYSSRTFQGGRGPDSFIHERGVYKNFVIAGSDFRSFNGTEEVRSSSGRGYHIYHGGLML